MSRRLPARVRRAADAQQPGTSSLPPEVVKALARRKQKYGNTACVVDGIRFDSLKEAGRYLELAPLARAGIIADLRVHTRWRLTVNDLEVAVYESDLDYLRGDVRVVEDVKVDATKTPSYQIKRKLMLACYGITVMEIE